MLDAMTRESINASVFCRLATVDTGSAADASLKKMSAGLATGLF